MDRAPYLIIGNSVAAIAAVEGIRVHDAERPITLVAREPQHTYSRPLISYLLAGEVDEARMFYRQRDFYACNNVNALLGVEVARLDTGSMCVQTADGRTFAFEKLLIATGGKPIVPRDVPGADTEGVFTFTTWDDALNIEEHIERHAVTEALVVGGGLIGLKCMEALVRRGVKTTVAELADRILSATFDATASDLATKALRKGGVDVRCGTTVSEITKQHGRVAGTALRDGTHVNCGMVVFAIGVTPNTDIVRDTSVRVERGIVVDETMQTSVPGIYAAGDVAQCTDLLTGRKQPIAIFPVAYHQGLVAGSNMAGAGISSRGAIAMSSVDILGMPTISVGLTAPHDDGFEALSELDEETSSYRKIVLKNGKVVGAIFIGDIAKAGIITGLIREGINVSGFRDLLLTNDFGLISLPAEYRKHVVSGAGIEV